MLKITKRLVISILSILVLVVISSCASKRYTNKAEDFEEAGLYSDAAEYYYEAVKRKDSNVEAKLGLKKNGQITLDRKLADFNEYYRQNNLRQAVYTYLEAETYYQKIKNVGVELNFPESNRFYFDEVRVEYLGEKYLEGLNSLDREDFSSALAIFTEIKNINPNYKDVDEKYKIARYEPVYREARSLMENESYRSAYYNYSSILEGAGDYKQARALMSEAREKGTISILVTQVRTSARDQQMAAADIKSTLESKLSALENPFIEVINAGTLSESVINNGKVNMQAANLAGIEAILQGEIKEFSKRTGQLKKIPQKGYLKEVVKIKTESGEMTENVTYHKTEYLEYQAENTASINVSYSLISTETSKVLVSYTFDKETRDEVHYAIFEGNNDKLVPGNWEKRRGRSPGDVIKDDKKSVRKLQNLLKADQKIKIAEQLVEELVELSISNILYKIDAYNPEKG